MTSARVQRLLRLCSVMVACGLVPACSNDNAGGTMRTPTPTPTMTITPGPGPAMPPPTPAMPSNPGNLPTAPVAGSPAMPTPPAPVAGSPAMPVPPDMPDPSMPHPLAMDECGLDTGYPGDEYCILPPPPDKGFQLHIGPDDYNNVDSRYILNAGGEITNNFSGRSTNTEMRYFYYRQFRQRPGAHHNIINKGGGLADSGRIGTTNRLSEDSPQGGIIAPENEGVGIPIGPNTTINVSLHSINTTDGPVLREIWVNFWYVPAENVTQPVEEMFATGDVAYAIPPGADTMIGPNRCTFATPGRMLWMYGHRHASNRRFSTWRIRGSQRDLIYESYNWEEPMVIEYSSTVVNPVPNRDTKVEGGWSGILDIEAGDVLEWECHIVNEQNTTLRFSNETYAGEMCIVDAELVGTNCGFGFGG